MRGWLSLPPEPDPARPDWESLALEAVGTVIEFWGFKRNQGRVWALLYLRGRPLAAPEILRDLHLSKGATSILLRELEQWGVVRRVRTPGGRSWRYEAEQDLMAMLRRVLRAREAALVSGVVADLERAEALVRQDPGAPPEIRARVARLLRLARAMDKALGAFLETGRFDASQALDALAGGAAGLRRGLARLRSPRA